MRTALGTIPIALLTTAVAIGCGDDEPAGEPTGETELEITLDADGPGGEEPLTAQVVCPGADAPRDACAAIERLPADAAAPVPPDTPCTEIYGGPDMVMIEGTLDDDEIDAGLSRANGCEIERFDRFLPLLRALFPDYRPGEAIQP